MIDARIAMLFWLPVAVFVSLRLPRSMAWPALYLSALYISTIVVAAIIGRSFSRGAQDSGQLGQSDEPGQPGQPGQPQGLGGISLPSLLLGIVAVVVASHLPFLGPLFAVVIVLTGLGLLVQHAQASWRLAQT